MNLVLSLTEACNLRCAYCYYRESQATRALEMPDSVLERSIEFAYERTRELKQNYLNITFFGGEPLLRVDAIRKGVAFAKRYASDKFRVRFAVNTNGTLLNSQLLDFFEAERILIYISIDGPREIHDTCRRTVTGNGCFDLIEPHIPRLVKQNAVVLRVISRKYIAGVSDSVRWIHGCGFKNMTAAVDFDGKWTSEDMDALAQEYRKLADFWAERKIAGDKFYLGTFQDKIRLRLENIRYKNLTCHILEGAIAVATDGGIFPCTRFISSCADAPYRLGDVFHGINPARAEELRKFLVEDKKECEGCALAPRCIAHECACISFYTTGSLAGVSPEVCAHERMLTEICDDAARKFLKGKVSQ